MPINIGTVTAEEATTTVSYGGETGKIVYRPGAMTPARLEEIAATLNDDEPSAEIMSTVQFLADMIVSWEIVQDDGATLPVTPDTVKALPIKFMGAIVNAIY